MIHWFKKVAVCLLLWTNIYCAAQESRFLLFETIDKSPTSPHANHWYYSQSANIGDSSWCWLRSSHCRLAVDRLATISALILFPSTTGLPLTKRTCIGNDSARVKEHGIHILTNTTYKTTLYM